jgi:hypothetical protein
MSKSNGAAGIRLALGKRVLGSLLSLAMVFAAWPQDILAQDPQAQTQGAPGPQDGQSQSPAGKGAPYNQQTPEQLQQLVAPIALYPDSLVAQILAASTFPEQVVEADRFVQAHPDLKGDALGQAVDQQNWDPSVKALAGFPSVLGNMDKNLSWTSSLGDAYYNQEADVMQAVQDMRQKAQATGNLKSTPQQVVTTQGPTIEIQPADPQVVYVPAYNPWTIYGGPIVAWPGWYPYPGIWWGGPFLSFGIGFGIGWYGGFGWGWNHWGFNWHGHYAVYNNNRYYSHSNTFYNRNNFYRNNARAGYNGHGYNAANRPPNAGHASVYNRPGATTHPFNGSSAAARGYTVPHAQPGTQTGTHSSAYSGYDHGGQTKSYSSRGSASMGGGASHGGGGAPHGGGGGGGSHGGGGGSHH